MNTKLLAAVLISGICLAPLSHAGHGFGGKKGAPPPHHSQSFYDEARVVDVEPIVRTVTISTPQQQCWDEQVHYSESRVVNGSAAGNMILGGILGGVIGSQFGRGDDRNATALAGTLIGASIGHDVGTRNARTITEPRVATEQRCQVSHEQHVEERIEGYQVSYQYRGEVFTTRLPYDPGDSIRVRVEVMPEGRQRY